MFLHKAIDLADWEAAGFAVLQRHGNQAAKKSNNKRKSAEIKNETFDVSDVSTKTS